MFDQEIWDEYCSKIERNFSLKTYPHVDKYFDFPDKKEEIKELIKNPVKIKKYSFLPFLKVLSKTPRFRYNIEEEKYRLETKIRPLLFASHKDTYIYGYYSHYLNRKYIELIKSLKIDGSILAYRPDLDGKCNIQFAGEAFELIRKKIFADGGCSVIALDIKGFFDDIDHKLLAKMWRKVLDIPRLPDHHYSIFKSLTQYSYINLTSFLKHYNIDALKRNKNTISKRAPRIYFNSLFDLLPINKRSLSFKNKMEDLRKTGLITKNTTLKDGKRILKGKGIPQGSAMSATLSNIYLLEFDQKMVEKGVEMHFEYRRYCDDILIICNSEDVVALTDWTINCISNDCHLIIQEKKKEIIHFEQDKSGVIRSIKNVQNRRYYRNLQYLGFEFNGRSIYIRPSSLSRYFRKMKSAITRTVLMAYKEDQKLVNIFKRRLYLRYTHLGHRNFLAYAYNASKEYYINSKGERKEGMNSPQIRKQINHHIEKLKQELERTRNQIGNLS